MKKRDRQLIELSRRLDALGISLTDQEALRRIEMVLHRWGEQECGDEHGNAIERDEETGIPYRTYYTGTQGGARGRYKIADKERGALKRLGEIMARYPALWAYHQGDPRGCALYVGEKKHLPRVDPSSEQLKSESRIIDGYYTRGVAVCL